MNPGSVILTYHSLDTSGSPISIPPAFFRRHMEILAASGRRVVPLREVLSAPGAAAITFDDGFRNFHDHAAPVLSERRFPATVFIVTGGCGKHNAWPGQPAWAPRLELMPWSELNAVAAAGFTIGAHSVRHPDLTRIPAIEAAREIRDSRRAIEDRTGRPAAEFAYPYGRVNARVRALAAAEFRIACGVSLRFATASSDPLLLPRIDAWYLRHPWLIGNLFSQAGKAWVSFWRAIRALRGAG
jgi:peptidoglycan/xylan/chitin deacetylase (PgdA/CDA1 family)